MRFHIETYGCTANQGDSESIAGLLVEAGHRPVPELRADLLILNTCTVKASTEQKILNRLRGLADSKKKLLVAGCMVQAQPELVREACPNANMLGIYELLRAAEAVESISRGRHVGMLAKAEAKKPDTKPVRTDPLNAIVQVSQGCRGSCTYCITRLARGDLRSFPPEQIVSEVECALKEGCKEIRITSQDNTVYGQDIGTSLPSLISKIDALPGDFRIRVGMMNPGGLLPLLPDLLEAYDSPKVYKFFHIPVQSGSNEILRQMNRRYTREDFIKIVSRIRSRFPLASIATDVIVGYPGETETQFQDTYDLYEATRPDVVNISRFTLRPGTPAAKLKPLSTQITKDRSRRMAELWECVATEQNRRYIGLNDRVLISEKGKNDTMVGRSSNYKAVVLPDGTLGDFVDVEFKTAFSTYLA